MRLARTAYRLAWVVLLLVALTAVGFEAATGGARPAAAVCNPLYCPTTSPPTTAPPTTSPPTTAPPTTAPPTTAPPTTTPPSTPYPASFVPCGAGTGPCTTSPQEVEVQYPAGAPPDAIQLNWDTSGRAAAAPNPDSTSVTLLKADGSSCGSQLWCWSWPAGMTMKSWILNGTYQVVVCPTGGYVRAPDGGTGSCGQPLHPQSVGVAVAPGPPTSVTAASKGPEVTVTWKPPASPPPDLAGYSVRRNGTIVYQCSTDQLGPGSSVPCPSSLTAVDHPGNGSFAYTVSAFRLGVDTASSSVVSSSAAGAGRSVAVPGPVSNPVSTGPTGSAAPGGAGTTVGLLPSPVIGGGTVVSRSGDGGAVSTAPQGLAGATADPALGTPQNLKYPTDNPVVGKPSAALALRVPPPRTDVVPVAVLALGILILAIAAHFLYLRVELSVLEAKLGSRRRRQA